MLDARDSLPGQCQTESAKAISLIPFAHGATLTTHLHKTRTHQDIMLFQLGTPTGPQGDLLTLDSCCNFEGPAPLQAKPCVD